MQNCAINELDYAFGKPESTALFKQDYEDFRVDEDLGFELSDQGEHLFLLMRKQGMNTEELAKILANYFDVVNRAVTYAGMKDKQAVTTQWFCVHLPGKDSGDLTGLNQEKFQLVQSKRHHKKLKIGYLKGNFFNIVLKQVNGDKTELEQRLEKIFQFGVPNYFGTQRFGHNGQNLIKAEQVLLHGKKIKNKFLRGVYYSAARSLLFNRILHHRIQQGHWDKALVGDAMQLAGSKSYFVADTVDDALIERLNSGDVSPAAPLWGEGKMPVCDQALAVQQMALEPWQPWCEALEKNRLNLAFRPIRLLLENLEWQWLGDDLQLSFTLPAGSYATAVLRELIVTNDVV